MKQQLNLWPTLWITLVIVVVCLLVAFTPLWLAAIVFVLLTAWLAIRTGRKHGASTGVAQFLKNMLFGW
jgi:uncharacterized membrane protein YdbT with pleckstrin-like domain